LRVLRYLPEKLRKKIEERIEKRRLSEKPLNTE